jgi:hypothetical protein
MGFSHSVDYIKLMHYSDGEVIYFQISMCFVFVLLNVWESEWHGQYSD